jgi:hypothetical protein
MTRSRSNVLQSARDTLRTAELGLRDLQSGPADRRFAALRNAVVLGRAVTNVLENLRSRHAEFDSWYKAQSDALATDVDMKFLYKLRSEILKKGTLPVASMFHVRELDTALDPKIFGSPPPGATHVFVDGSGIGWHVALPNGTEEKYYAQLPPEVGNLETLFVAANGSTRDAAELVERYLAKMRELVDTAEQLFGDAA